MTKQVAQFIRSRLPDNFSGWTDEALEDYVMFHVEHMSIACAVDPEKNVEAVVIGWPVETMEVPKFCWKQETDRPSFWYWDQIAGNNPIAVMSACALIFKNRIESVMLPGFAVRNKRVRRVKNPLGLYRKGERIYGRISSSTSS